MAQQATTSSAVTDATTQTLACRARCPATGIAGGYEAQSTGRVLTDVVDAAVSELIRGSIDAQPN
jgi:hypothetical protein